MKNCYEKNVDFDEKLQLYFLRCTAFFIMLSEKPEYNSKIETMSALAPAVLLKHCKSRLIRLLKPFVSALYVRFQLNLVSSFIFKKKLYIQLLTACQTYRAHSPHLSGADTEENISKCKTHSKCLRKSFEFTCRKE